MSATRHASKPAGSKPTPPPFGGLAFNLDAVRETARQLTVASYPAMEDDRCRLFPCDVPRLSGYGLLTALGREIRGR